MKILLHPLCLLHPVRLIDRGVARGGAEGALAPPEFGRSVDPIQTRGADYAPHTTASPPRIQKAIYTSDNNVQKRKEDKRIRIERWFVHQDVSFQTLNQ